MYLKKLYVSFTWFVFNANNFYFKVCTQSFWWKPIFWLRQFIVKQYDTSISNGTNDLKIVTSISIRCNIYWAPPDVHAHSRIYLCENERNLFSNDSTPRPNCVNKTILPIFPFNSSGHLDDHFVFRIFDDITVLHICSHITRLNADYLHSK